MPLEPFSLSINMLTLFAFILVLGIVVDDAIVIGESAYSEIETKGQSLDNVIRGAKKVAMPATFGGVNHDSGLHTYVISIRSARGYLAIDWYGCDPLFGFFAHRIKIDFTRAFSPT